LKYTIVILGGAADQPQPELNEQTPLQAANTATLDRIAGHGRLGQVALSPPGVSDSTCLGPDAAALAMLGYDSARLYPGPAPLHALGMGLDLGPGDWAFNLGLVSVVDGVIQAPARLQVTPGESQALVRDLVERFDLPGAVVYPGEAGSHLMIDPAGADASHESWQWDEVETHHPLDIVGVPLRKCLPVGGQAGERLQQFIAMSEVELAGHEINQARREMDEPLITHLWPWGQGRHPVLTPWPDRFGKTAAMITSDATMQGLAIGAGLDPIHAPAARPEADDSSFSEGDLIRLGVDAVDALAMYDVVIVHVRAPHLASLDGSVPDKVRAIELADTHVIKPIDQALTAGGQPYRLLVTPLHATLAEAQRSVAMPMPFLIAGEKITNVVARPLTEADAEQADLQVEYGHELMEFFLKGGMR